MPLTERRKADREKMADYFEGNWIAAPGFTCNRLRSAPGWPGERCITLLLKGPRSILLSLDFDGDSAQPDTHVLSWHIASDSEAKFSTRFAHSTNLYHYRKATDVVRGFEALKDLMSQRISFLQSGEAFKE